MSKHVLFQFHRRGKALLAFNARSIWIIYLIQWFFIHFDSVLLVFFHLIRTKKGRFIIQWFFVHFDYLVLVLFCLIRTKKDRVVIQWFFIHFDYLLARYDVGVSGFYSILGTFSSMSKDVLFQFKRRSKAMFAFNAGKGHSPYMTRFMLCQFYLWFEHHIAILALNFGVVSLVTCFMFSTVLLISEIFFTNWHWYGLSFEWDCSCFNNLFRCTNRLSHFKHRHGCSPVCNISWSLWVRRVLKIFVQYWHGNFFWTFGTFGGSFPSILTRLFGYKVIQKQRNCIQAYLVSF